MPLGPRTKDIFDRMRAEGKLRIASVHEVHRDSYDARVRLKEEAEQKQRASIAYAADVESGRADLRKPDNFLSGVYRRAKTYFS